MLLAYVTCASEKEAEKIAGVLVKEKLVACANIIPRVKSVFFWDGELKKPSEALLLCKVPDGNEQLVEKKIKEMHSYEIPCIIFYEAKHVNKEYLDWSTNL